MGHEGLRPKPTMAEPPGFERLSAAAGPSEVSA